MRFNSKHFPFNCYYIRQMKYFMRLIVALKMVVWIALFSFSTSGLFASDDNRPAPGNNIQTQKTGVNKDICVIVRLQVSGNKINFLKSKLNESLSENARNNVQEQLNETLEDNASYFKLLAHTFDSLFTIAPVYYLPDSSYRRFMAGQKGLFYNKHGQPDPSLSCDGRETFFIIAGKDRDQLLFVNASLHKMDKPFPYKKSVFLPSFKKILNLKGYLAAQVKYFNQKLSTIYP